MSRLFMGMVLFVFAGELLGGCAHSTVVSDREVTGGKTASKIAALMAKARQAGKPSDALKDVQQAAELDPSNENIAFVASLLAEDMATDPARRNLSVTPDDGFPEPDVGRNVPALLAGARLLYEGQHYRQAQDMIREAAILDPHNDTAFLMLRLVSTKIIDRDYEATKQRTGTEVTRQNTDSAEHLIPYSDLVVYPDNWPETTRRREDAK